MSSSSLLIKYFPDLSPEQIKRFDMLGKLYPAWNEQINVISRKDMEFLYERHILHSLGIAKVTAFRPGTQVLDVGTGGGFPGIPLAILFPGTQFHLIDSIGKKIKVVNAIKEELKLDNVLAQQTRAETLKSKYHFVVSRAVTRLLPFWKWVQSKFIQDSFNTLPNGLLYLKGGDLQEELTELNRPYRLFALSDYFDDFFFETKKVVFIKR